MKHLRFNHKTCMLKNPATIPPTARAHTRVHSRSMNNLAPYALLGLLGTSLAASLAAAADGDDYQRHVAPFLKTHCLKCHGEKDPKSEYRVDVLAADLGVQRAAWAGALERLKAGDMPPDTEPRPEKAAAGKVAQWIEAQLLTEPAEAAQESAARVLPVDGNRVPHALLFGAKATATIPPQPRLWRLRPSGYSDGFVAALRGNAKNLSQPFNLIAEPGIKDYAELYSIDIAGTDVLLRNAGRIVEGQTSHQMKADEKSPGKLRVSMGNDTIREFAPLLHPTEPATLAQLETAIRRQYQLALVREPTPEEIAKLTGLYEKNVRVADRVSAARTMLMAPLLSSEAMYRFELGRGAEVRPGVRQLSSQELAFAITLSLADKRDQKLFEAAAKDELTSREAVATHVQRLLDDDKYAKPRLLGFFREYFGYDNATEVFKNKPDDVIHRPEVYVGDTDKLVLHLLANDKDVLRELLTTRKSFVNADIRTDSKTKETTLKPRSQAHPVNDKGRKSPEVAYGFAEFPKEQPVELPAERIGLLMQPSWLVAWSGNFDTDPVRRGRFVRERLLGGRVPDLPIGVAAKVPDDPHRTLRDRLQVTRDAACWKCHQKMDELGLPFEQFEHYGKWRDVEKVVDVAATEKNVDKKGKALGTIYTAAPLNTAGTIAASGDPALDGPVQSPAEMLRRLAESERVRQVFIRHVFRYYLGRNETAGDARALQEADAAYVKSGGSFKALLVSLLSSESFLYRSVPAITPTSSTGQGRGVGGAG